MRAFKPASVRRRARSLGLAIVGASVGVALCAPGAMASGSAQGPPAGPKSPPFTQCPPNIGADTSCEYLIDVTPTGLPKVVQDRTQPFYDAGQPAGEKGDDVTVGVQNDTGSPLASIHAGVAESADRLFAFDGDGLCWSVLSPKPSECPFSSNTYDGPATNLVAESPDAGTVFFNPPLQPGQYTYFALEAAPTKGIVAGEVNDYVSTLLTNTQTKETGDALSAPSPVPVTDQATLKGPNAKTATGTVEYLLYEDANCEKPPVQNLGKMTVVNGVAQPSNPSSSGLHTNATYFWVAKFTPAPKDPNSANSSPCGSETMTFGTPPALPKPSITTVLSEEGQRGTHITVREGVAVTDTAIVTPLSGQHVTGRVSYAAYPSASCTGSAIPGLGGGGTTTGIGPSTNPVVLSAGKYYFQAFYSGSPQLGSAVTPCGEEVLTVLAKSSPRPGPGGSSPGQFNIVGHLRVDERNGRILITVELPAAGAVTATGVVKQGSLARVGRVRAESAKGKKCRRGSVRKHGRCRGSASALYGAASLTARAAGTYTVVITPATRMLTGLRHGKKLFVTVSATFRNSSGGAPVTRVQSVLAKIKKKAHRKR